MNGLGCRLRNAATRVRSTVLMLTLAAALYVGAPRRAAAEDRLDFKVAYYLEDDDRMKILSPSFLYETDLSQTLTIKITGVYDSMSGATPTGAPGAVPPSSASPSGAGPTRAPNEGSEESDFLWNYHAKAGASQAATPTPAGPSRSTSTAGGGSDAAATPAPSGVPMAELTDTRYAGDVELAQRLGRHTVTGRGAYSTEKDYESLGLVAGDAIDFNERNTRLTLAVAVTRDRVDILYNGSQDTKTLLDAMVGVTQTLGRHTLLTANLTLGQASGYLSDPYRVAQVDGVLVPERRPDSKDRQVAYLSLTQFMEALRASVEATYRYGNDSFGVSGHTVGLNWFQKLGHRWIVNPMVRFYEQGEADFYGATFVGTPEYYSADYRLSTLTATSAGLKLIWKPGDRWSVDLGYERYEMAGADDVTADDMYPSANIVTAGARVWF